VHPQRHRPARKQVVLIDDAAQHETNIVRNPRAPIPTFTRRVHSHEQANKHSTHEPAKRVLPWPLYTSDAADEMQWVDFGGGRIMKKQKPINIKSANTSRTKQTILIKYKKLII